MVLFLFPSQASSSSSPSTRRTHSKSTSSTSSASSTLAEALRGNPFGTGPRSRRQKTDDEEQERERAELNDALEKLVLLFPDISVEVFRELLARFDGDSRLQVCVEQLLRYRAEWVKGRWNTDPKTPKVPEDEKFRSVEYKTTVKGMLVKEFGGLSRSAVDAVLAENNFSYTKARPTLRDLSKKSWRVTIGSLLFGKKKDKDEVHPLLVVQKVGNDTISSLRGTGCAELDKELYGSILGPLLRQKKDEREQSDFNLAISINEIEAKAAEALYECDCCYSDSPFEFISTCSATGHIICFDCIRRTIHEALFGQGWGKSIDHEKGTLKCLAASINDSCTGCISHDLVKRAILSSTTSTTSAKEEEYRKFESRLADESLLKSQYRLIRCPFCNYAEVDPTFPPYQPLMWHIRCRPITLLLTFIVLLDLVPLLLLFVPMFILSVITSNPQPVLPSFHVSVHHLARKARTSLFRCQNPTCQQTSCQKCHKAWAVHMQHVCHEPLLTSLRTTVEAARTAAIKRTCPRCGLSFVKSSGCNKLTCVCGYAMCYLCRKALGPKAARHPNGRNRPRRLNLAEQAAMDLDDDETLDPDAGDDVDPQEGYRHFCDHFRITPGSPCTECDKCDLYRAEDEEVVVRRAGERAEKLWKIRNGAEVEAVGDMRDLTARAGAGNLDGRDGVFWVCLRVWRGLSAQGVLDWAVERVVLIEG